MFKRFSLNQTRTTEYNEFGTEVTYTLVLQLGYYLF